MLVAVLAFGLTLKSFEPNSCAAPIAVNCASARQLANSDDFQAALRRFVGDAHGNYRRGNRLLYKEVEVRLAVPEDAPVDLGGGAKLFAGCMRFVCPEKAAVIVDASGVAAIGVLDYHSDNNPTLEVLVQRSGVQSTLRANILRAWADRAVARDAGLMHAPLTVRAMRVRALQEEKTAAPVYAKACSKLIQFINRCP
jgi:hypothetical protein